MLRKIYIIKTLLHNGADVKLRPQFAFAFAKANSDFTPSYACACAIIDCFAPSLRSVTTALTLSYVLSLHLPAQTQIRTLLRATLKKKPLWRGEGKFLVNRYTLHIVLFLEFKTLS